MIDVDGNPGYQANGRNVLYAYRTLSPGDNCLPRNGLDNVGDPVPSGATGSVIVEMIAWLTHFPVWDAETNPNGFHASIARPAGLPAPKMFWDNRGLTKASPRNANLDGCTSNCDVYTNSDEENVNTWVAAIAATDSQPFTLAGVCDTDQDGIPDLIEVGGTNTDGDGRVDGTFVDADNDGWADALDNNGSSTGTAFTLFGLDSDGIDDFLNLDDENDGISDLVEVGDIDANADGMLDATSDADGDGLADVVDPSYDIMSGTSVTGTPHFVTNADTDSDNLPNGVCAACDFDGDGYPNYRDLDADGDGIPDRLEARGMHGNKNDLADNGAATPTFTDSDNDGLTDDRMSYAGVSAGGAGQQVFAQALDVDGDGRPNWLDIDADGDGITDNTEAFGTNSYTAPTSGPGSNTDTDGLNTAYDDGSGHGGNTTDPVDSDSDGTPDYLDLDSDGDKLPDAIEGHDTNDDGVVDGSDSAFAKTGQPTGADVDGDGLDYGYDKDIAAADVTNGAGQPTDYSKQNVSNADQDWRHEDLNVVGNVWADENSNGRLDGLEMGISGATVELYDGAALVATATTGPDGSYTFIRKPASTAYTVKFVQPSGYGAMSPQDASFNDADDSDADPATNTTSVMTLAAGNLPNFVSGGFLAAPLPVHLISFAASSNNCNVLIEWATASEQNLDRFAVERQSEHGSWQRIKEHPAQGDGAYSTIDADAASGTSYYRLVSVDLDGTKAYSNTIAVVSDCDKVVRLFGHTPTQYVPRYNYKGCQALPNRFPRLTFSVGPFSFR